jgi:AmmeMemoRadiSam system protein A
MFQLTSEEKRFLLRLARSSLESAVHGRPLPPPSEIPAKLQACGSAFVTIHRGSDLRGCVGLLSNEPLHKSVMEAAASAGLNDPRFPRLAPAELTAIRLEISVLSPFLEMHPHEIEIGVHGLVVSRGSCRGLLLPQVAAERKWTPEKFLEETCKKAGLPPDAWKRGARIEGFTAEVFGEDELSQQEARPA